MKIIIATNNSDKLAELRSLLEPTGCELMSMAEAGFTKEIAEEGVSYRENAYLKAKAVFDFCRCPVLADDTGLSVDLLDGAPGLYTARFAGVKTSYADKIETLWSLLKPYPKQQWTASFHCALCFIYNDEAYYFSGQVEGVILDQKRGTNGFGYDPVFYIPDIGLTTAEMLPEDKNKISHRGIAIAKFRNFLQDFEEEMDNK
ncbi:MAG: RdgB/HAM1 family non-canonical purine NTP pyrophosphatase [Clostridiaceae bacterium]|nr:RdgB/HAM1 family non-canonical purine NTP pyrophosphatase [Clostridiaceae bacterium]